MNVVIAIDSFKGSLSSMEAGEAVARGVRRAIPEAVCQVRPLADGGEGTVDALVEGLGGTRKSVSVTGPSGKPVTAVYGLLPDGTAVMEMAQAAGITLVSGAEKNPLTTTTYGVGEMILDAIKNGATKFIIGIGGSATNDGGVGMLQALGYRFLDNKGRELPRGGAALKNLVEILPPPIADQMNLHSISFRVACDVKNPLCGPTGASAVYGPQKGATSEMVAELDAALQHYATVTSDFLTMTGNSMAEFPGTGAAGGLGFALKTFLLADLVPGVELILTETKLADYLQNADIVVTGEGRLDGQTVMGKAPIGVAHCAKNLGEEGGPAPVIAFCGCVGDGVETVNASGIDAYFPILRRVTTLEEALEKKTAARNLSNTAEQVFRAIKIRV